MDVEATPVGFCEAVLGLESNYPWQDRAIAPLALATGLLSAEPRRINISVVTPNGSGKDERIIPACAYWWLALHPRGKVIITSKSDLQITQQTIPSLEKHRTKFEGFNSVESPRYELTTPTGGKIIAFVTNHPGRVEGWHKEDDKNGPLLIIVNEAKSVDEDIFQALDRCTPNAVMYLSSPGLMQGRFYDTFTKLKTDWITIQAGLKDCPHIPQERIDYVRRTYGENHPITKSTIDGEFMEQDEQTKFCVLLSDLQKCYDSPPKHTPGLRYLFFDFSDAGRAQNVACLRDGNKYTIEDAWRDTDQDAVIGRCIYIIRKLRMKPGEVGGDAAAKEILDGIGRALGWNVYRQPFGIPKNWSQHQGSQLYTSWSAMAWIEGGNKIKRRECILPEDDEFKAQVTTREKLFAANGKQKVKDKLDMAKDGLPSPDKGDAFFGAMAREDNSVLMKDTWPRESRTEEWEREQHEGVLEEIGASAGY